MLGLQFLTSIKDVHHCGIRVNYIVGILCTLGISRLRVIRGDRKTVSYSMEKEWELPSRQVTLEGNSRCVRQAQEPQCLNFRLDFRLHDQGCHSSKLCGFGDVEFSPGN